MCRQIKCKQLHIRAECRVKGTLLLLLLLLATKTALSLLLLLAPNNSAMPATHHTHLTLPHPPPHSPATGATRQGVAVPLTRFVNKPRPPFPPHLER